MSTPVKRKPRSAISRQPIYPRLSDDVLKRFKAYVAATGNTESAVVEAALQEYMDPARDARLIKARLDRAGFALGRIENNNALVLETLLAFVRTWFENVPEKDAERAEAARRSGKKRFKAFQEDLARAIAAGSSSAPRGSVVPDDANDWDRGED